MNTQQQLHKLGIKTSIFLWLGMGILVGYWIWKTNTQDSKDN